MRRIHLYVLLVALLIGLAIRLGIAFSEIELTGDEVSRYVPLATNLTQGNGFTISGVADDFNVPVYPAFIAAIFLLTGESIRAVIVVQLLLELVIIYVLWLIAKELKFSTWQQVAAVSLALVCPFLPVMAGQLLTEVLATLLMTLFLLFILRRYWLLAGVIAGLGLLTRPDLLPAFGAAVIVTLVLSRQFKGAALATICACLLVSLWGFRNLSTFGTFLPLGRVTEQTNYTYARWLNTWLDDPRQMHAAWWQPAEIPPDDVLIERTRTAWTDEPVRVGFIVPVKRAFMTWLRLPTYIQSRPLKILAYVFWVGLSLTSLYGCYLLLRQKQWTLLILLAVVAGRIILPLVSALGAEPRYIIECLPACFLLAAQIKH
jgi:hypothetical protein